MIKRALAIAPNIPGNHLLLAQSALLRGDLQAVQAELEAEEIVWQGDSNSQLLAADLYLALGHPEIAKEIIENLLAHLEEPSGTGSAAGSSFRFGALLRLLQADIAMGNMNGASARFSQLPSMGPLSHGVVIEYELNQLNLSKAKETLARIPRAAAEDISTVLHRYTISVFERNLPAMERDLARLRLALGKHHPFVHLFSAATSSFRGAFDHARAELAQIAPTNIHSLPARLLDIHMDIDEGKTPAAERKLSALMKECPAAFTVVEQTPWIPLRRGNYAEAAHLADNVLKVHRNSMRGLLASGLSQAAIGKSREALRVGEELSRKNPASPLAKMIQARALSKMGRLQEARAVALEARRLSHYDNTTWPLVSPSAILAEIEEAEGCNTGNRCLSPAPAYSPPTATNSRR